MLAVIAAAALAAAIQPTVVAVDTETTVGGVPVACTGIGLDARNEPRWQAYPLRVELSNAINEYLAGGVVTVRAVGGAPLLSARCDAPWLLLRLPPGRYAIQAEAEGSTMKPAAAVTPPASGQMRVVLQFRDR